MNQLPVVSRIATWGVFCFAASATSAQTVYRCANSYSQTPCAGALAIAVDDSRSPAQKAQTDAATVQTQRLAGQLERERLALEQSARAAKLPPSLAKPANNGRIKHKAGNLADASAGRQAPGASGKKQKKDPEFFTASVSPDKKPKAGDGTAD